jgi:hypothetical protein
MGISPSKSKSNVVQAERAAFGKLAFHKILYRASFFVALLVCVVLSAASVSAQEERPQITPGERKAPRKQDAGPRAVGVLQIAANGKASLVPIAILVGGKFWDATAYKADPIPMAVEPGTVYEAERAGSSLGLFTVNSALHSNAVNVQTPWIGTGAWVPEGAEKPKTALKAEKAPVGIDPTDAPPRLTRSASAPQGPPTTTPVPTPQGSSGPTGSGQTSPGQTNPNQTSSTQTSPNQTSPSPSSPGPAGSRPTPPAPTSSAPASPGTAKPTDSKPGDSKTTEPKPPDRPSTPQSDSGAGEANRPRLRRGKPVEPLPEDEVQGYSKLGTVASTAPIASAGKNPEPTAEKAPVQLMPAISDAGGPEPKSFAFEWLKDEEGERLKQITALAKEQVRAYVEARAKSKITPMPAPKSAGSQAGRRASTSKTPGPKTGDPILENAQMKAFDLWGNNQPVMVFTADAHMPPPAASAAHAASDSDLQYSILLVANHDIYNNLHKLFVSVTDKYHLDINPRLELVDALDADGDGRGELLFHEISDTGNGWIIYRATPDKLAKLFDSLNP